MAELRIEIETDSAGNRQIVVRDQDGNGTTKNPDVEVNSRGSIKWKAKEAGEKFRVFFFTDSTRTTVFWPFEMTGPKATPPDGYDACRPYLEVVRQQKKCDLNVSGPWSIKYDVVKEPPDGVPALDPVIIIKPPVFNLGFGLICAVAGAIVGALLALRFWQ